MLLKVKKLSQIERLDLNGPIAIDTETSGLRVWKNDKPFAVSMCDQNGTTAYYDFPVDPFTREPKYDPKAVEEIRSIVADPNIVKVFHNSKFDLRMMERHMGISFQGKIHETLIMGRVYNSIEPTLQLKPLAHKYLGYPTDDEKDLQKAVVRARKEAKKRGWNIHEAVKADYWLPKALDPESTVCEKYARLDAERTMGMYLFYSEKFEQWDWEAYDLETRLWPVVYEMEGRGVRIHKGQTEKELAYNEKRMEETEAKMYALAGCTFNEDSHQQLARVLYEIRKLEVMRETKQSKVSKRKGLEHTPRPSTDWKALRHHLNDPFVRALCDYRAAKSGVQFFKNYLDLAVPDSLNKNGWCIHGSFDQAAARTGRFGARDPNLQNLTVKENPTGAEPAHARKVFGPRPGYVWYAFDMSQVELRILAHLCQDPALLDAFNNGRDIHSEVANKAWGGKGNPQAIKAAIDALELQHNAPSSDAVKSIWTKFSWQGGKEYKYAEAAEIADKWLATFGYDIVKAEASLGKETTRKRAKNVMYLKIYGGGPSVASEQLLCDFETAQTFLNDIDRAFPSAREYTNSVQIFAEKHGYIETVYGRRLRVDPFEPHKAANYQIQGSAAQQIKTSMIKVADYLKDKDLHIVLTVHDELMIEAKLGENKISYLKEIKRLMEQTDGKFSIPLPVDCSRVISSWEQKEKVKL